MLKPAIEAFRCTLLECAPLRKTKMYPMLPLSHLYIYIVFGPSIHHNRIESAFTIHILQKASQHRHSHNGTKPLLCPDHHQIYTIWIHEYVRHFISLLFMLYTQFSKRTNQKKKNDIPIHAENIIKTTKLLSNKLQLNSVKVLIALTLSSFRSGRTAATQTVPCTRSFVVS